MPSEKTAMVEFESVSLSYGRKTPLKDMRKRVLDDVSLNIGKGEILCLVLERCERALDSIVEAMTGLNMKDCK